MVLEEEVNDTILTSIVSALSGPATQMVTIFGLFGNIFSLVVFISYSDVFRTTTITLKVLAFNDSLLMLTSFLVMFQAVETSHAMFCKLLHHIMNASFTASAWLLVLLTAERLLIILRPMKYSQVVTRKVTIFASLLICVISMLLHAYTSVTYVLENSMGNRMCNPDRSQQLYISLHMGIVIMDVVITYFIPALLMVIMNTKIHSTVRKFYQYVDTVNEMTTTCASETEMQVPPVESRNSSYQELQLERYCQQQQQPVGNTRVVNNLEQDGEVSNKTFDDIQMQITVVLFILSMVFLVLNLPAYLIRTLLWTLIQFDPDDSLQLNWNVFSFFQSLANFFMVINVAANFFLYAWGSLRFRRCSMMILKKFGRSCCKMMRPIYECRCCRNSRNDETVS